MFRRLLIANRGEIAVRIIHALFLQYLLNDQIIDKCIFLILAELVIERLNNLFPAIKNGPLTPAV